MTSSRAKRGTDAHVHFWDPRVLHYPWLADLPSLERPFLFEDYRAVSTAERVLFVECNALPAERALEIAFVERLNEPAIAGIVAFADVATLGAAALDSLPPIVKGVRQNIQGMPAGWCLTRSFVEGVQAATVFDLCVTHEQLDDAIALVDRCPNTRFVLDHCGKPRIGVRDTPAIRDGVLDPWHANLARLAERPHVSCKLSGLMTEAAPGATFDDLAPYASHVVECFGVDRVMYGSDWPVVTLTSSYADWGAFVDRFSASWSPDERSAFYDGNAVRVYGL